MATTGVPAGGGRAGRVHGRARVRVGSARGRDALRIVDGAEAEEKPRAARVVRNLRGAVVQVHQRAAHVPRHVRERATSLVHQIQRTDARTRPARRARGRHPGLRRACGTSTHANEPPATPTRAAFCSEKKRTRTVCVDRARATRVPADFASHSRETPSSAEAADVFETGRGGTRKNTFDVTADRQRRFESEARITLGRAPARLLTHVHEHRTRCPPRRYSPPPSSRRSRPARAPPPVPPGACPRPPVRRMVSDVTRSCRFRTRFRFDRFRDENARFPGFASAPFDRDLTDRPVADPDFRAVLGTLPRPFPRGAQAYRPRTFSNNGTRPARCHFQPPYRPRWTKRRLR